MISPKQATMPYELYSRTTEELTINNINNIQLNVELVYYN